MNRGRVLIGGVVLGCLVAVAALLLTMPASLAQETKLESIVHTTVEDFNAGVLYHTGLARSEQEDGWVQLLVMGISGEWLTDTNTTGLPPLAYHTAVHHDGHILVLGGMTTGAVAQNKVYYTTILPEENFDLDDWQTTTALPSDTYPNGLYWHTSVVLHDRVYVIGGGHSETSTYDTVSFAPIHSDGTLGDWTETTSLPVGLNRAQAVVVNGRIYVIGGFDGSGATAKVYYAKPDPDTGEIGSWTPTTADFSHNTVGHMVAVYDGRIYVMGGYHPVEFVTNKVYYAAPKKSGDITAWTENTSTMLENLYGAVGFSFSGALFTTGGAKSGLTSPSPYVGVALINPDGSIPVSPWQGGWRETENIDPARFFHATVVGTGGWFYIINGHDGTKPITNINRGLAAGEGAEYAPYGTYTSPVINLKKLSRLRELSWNSTISDTDHLAITLAYRAAPSPGNWGEWSAPHDSEDMTTTWTLPGDEALHFQYVVTFTSAITDMTPKLNLVQLKYEIIPFQCRLIKSAQPESGSIVDPGDIISYTMTYSNPIDGIPCEDAEIRDALPEYLDYKEGSIFGPAPDDNNKRNLKWYVGTIDPGMEGTLGFSAVVSDALKPEELEEDLYLTNRGKLIADNGSTRSNAVSHIVEALECNILIDLDADPKSESIIAPGDKVAYTIYYENAGEIPLSQATLTSTILPPNNFAFSANPSPNAGDYVWDLGPLDVGDSGTVDVEIKIDDIFFPKDWKITNQAMVSSPSNPLCKPKVSPMVTHTIGSDPDAKYVDLVLKDVRWVPYQVKAGSKVKFYASIANRGDLDAGSPFWLELYIKKMPADPPTGPSDHNQGFCLNNCAQTRDAYLEFISSLKMGQGFEVQFKDLSWVYSGQDDYLICAQVDVAFDDPNYNPDWGAHPEASEKNNIRCEILSMPRVYLPVINRLTP